MFIVIYGENKEKSVLILVRCAFGYLAISMEMGNEIIAVAVEKLPIIYFVHRSLPTRPTAAAWTQSPHLAEVMSHGNHS